MEAMEPGVKNMKKNLAIRAGAIVLVLMIAFFSILPDLVNAEGDDDPAPSTEVAAEMPDAGETGTETSSPDTSEGDATDWSTEETPDTPDTPDVPETPDTTEIPDQPVEPEVPDASEVPDTQQPVVPEPGTEITTPEQPGTETPDTTPVLPNGDGAANTESTENEGFGNDLQDEDEELPPNHELDPSDEPDGTDGDFTIEGTTVIAYSGAGGNIAIPAGVTAIGDGVFSGNGSITGVSFPDSLQIIGGSAFNGCSSLEAVSIPGSVTIVGASAFANCNALASVSLSGSAGAISQRQFYNCSSLGSVTVPDGVTSIGAEAFGSCGNLSSVSLPSTLSSLDMSAFSGCANLGSITVSSSSYSSYDGCVYTADGRHLLLCPQGKTGISFAPGILSVASGAFNGCSYLLTAVIPDAANAIEANAFSGSGIRAITIPASVTSIGPQSGWAPTVVYGYSGTTAESWANENNYVFESIDDPSGGVADETEEIEDPDPNDTDDPGEEPGGTTPKKPGGSNTTGTNSGTSTSTVHAASPGTANGTSAAIAGNGRIKDATPKTGVEEYGIYFLFGAIFLVGISLFAYSRKLRLEGK